MEEWNSTNKLLEAKESLAKLLQEAQARAMDSLELNTMFRRKMDLLTQPFAEFLKNLDEYDKLDEEIKKHIVVVKTLPEYRMLLEKTANTATVEDTLAHENAHLNKAESLGVPVEGYAIIVSKNEKGFVYAPYAEYKMPTSWDQRRQIEANIQIANAPHEYGNRLSPTDEKRIEELKKQLEN